MKTSLTIALAALMLPTIATAQGIEVTVDGDRVNFYNAQPQMSQGRVLVPLRGVFEKLGAQVLWHPADRMVTATAANTDVRLRIGSTTAIVNGQTRTLDVAPTLVNGTTLVPLRFLSESLGAEVNWIAPSRRVEIITAAAGSQSFGNQNQMTTVEYATMSAGTVLPVRLDDALNSRTNRIGDTFTATLRQDDRIDYAGLPWNTKVVGKIVAVRPKQGNDPGLIDVQFTNLRTPDGSVYPISGSLITLSSDTVDRNSEGVLVAKSDRRDERWVYAGVGAGAGVIVGILTRKPLEGGLIGAVLGYLYGENKRRVEGEARDVDLRPGTEFGVVLNQDVRVRRQH